MTAHQVAGSLVASVWIFHGLYSKLLHGIPRHREIVARVLGPAFATPVTIAVGLAEILLGAWVLTGHARIACATIQTLALIAMNTLEIWRARDLLIHPTGMVALNLAFLALAWWWAVAPT
jgi:1,6-anhydro-N-acetylmuramate kinase